jgi:hypothetical protein
MFCGAIVGENKIVKKGRSGGDCSGSEDSSKAGLFDIKDKPSIFIVGWLNFSTLI